MSGFTLINVGATANDGTGDSLRVSQQAVNSNFLTATRSLSLVANLASESAASGYTRIVQDLTRGGIFKAVNGGTPNSGTIFESATVGWTWQRVYEGNIQASWFGVTADGVTDDEEALRLAIIASDGKTLELPNGTINVLSQISATVDKIIIEGSEATIKSGSSIDGSLINLSSCSNFKCKNVVFDGNSNGTLIGLRIDNVETLEDQSAILNNCKFQNFTTSSGSSVPYGCLFYGSFKNVSILNSDFLNIKNEDTSGERVAKGARCSSSSSLQGTENFYVNNCNFKEISPINDADAVHHNWVDGGLNSIFTVENCSFLDIAKRCVKSQILGNTTVSNCKAENTNIEALECVNYQYGGGSVNGFTYVCSSTANAPTQILSFDRFSNVTNGVIVSDVKIIGSEDFNGYVCDIEPENGEGYIDFVNIDNVISSINLSKFAKYRANSNAVDVAQVDEINFSNIKLKNLTGPFLDLYRGSTMPGYEGPTFQTLANVSVLNVSNLGASQNFYDSGASDNPTFNGLNILKWENVKGIIFQDEYLTSQISNTRHTISNSLNYNIAGPNNSVISATNELKYADTNSEEITFDASSDISTVDDTITSTSHPFSDGDQVVAYSNGNTLPTGVSESVRYYVKSVDANTIKLYTNSGLTSVVDITAAGSGDCKILQITNIFKISLYDGVSGPDTRGHLSTAFVKWQFAKHSATSGAYISEDWISVQRFDASITYNANKVNEVENFSLGYVEPKWIFDAVSAGLYFPSGVSIYSGVQFYVNFLSGLSGDGNLARSIGVFTWLI